MHKVRPVTATCLWAMNKDMSGGTYAKRPINKKEHARQQRQRDKAERRNRRRQEKPVEGSVDEMAELREHAAAQAALFNIGVEETGSAEEPHRRVTRDCKSAGAQCPGNQIDGTKRRL